MLVTVCVSNSSALSEDDCKGLYGTYSRACNANNMDYIFSGIEDRHFDATWKQFSWIQFDNLCSNSVWYNKAHVNYPIFKSKVCRINEFEKYLLEWAANENIKTNGKFDIKTFAVKIRKESATKATVIFNTKETSNEITRKFTNINGKWAQVK